MIYYISLFIFSRVKIGITRFYGDIIGKHITLFLQVLRTTDYLECCVIVGCDMCVHRSLHIFTNIAVKAPS